MKCSLIKKGHHFLCFFFSFIRSWLGVTHFSIFTYRNSHVMNYSCWQNWSAWFYFIINTVVFDKKSFFFFRFKDLVVGAPFYAENKAVYEAGRVFVFYQDRTTMVSQCDVFLYGIMMFGCLTVYNCRTTLTLKKLAVLLLFFLFCF